MIHVLALTGEDEVISIGKALPILEVRKPVDHMGRDRIQRERTELIRWVSLDLS